MSWFSCLFRLMQLWIVTVASARISVFFSCRRMPFFSSASTLLIKLVGEWALNVVLFAGSHVFVFFDFALLIRLVGQCALNVVLFAGSHVFVFFGFALLIKLVGQCALNFYLLSQNASYLLSLYWEEGCLVCMGNIITLVRDKILLFMQQLSFIFRVTRNWKCPVFFSSQPNALSFALSISGLCVSLPTSCCTLILCFLHCLCCWLLHHQFRYFFPSFHCLSYYYFIVCFLMHP